MIGRMTQGQLIAGIGAVVLLVAMFLLGVVAVILIAAYLTVDFPDGADRKIGAFIGAAAAIAIAYGGFRAMQEEVAGEI